MPCENRAAHHTCIEDIEPKKPFTSEDSPTLAGIVMLRNQKKLRMNGPIVDNMMQPIYSSVLKCRVPSKLSVE